MELIKALYIIFTTCWLVWTFGYPVYKKIVKKTKFSDAFTKNYVLWMWIFLVLEWLMMILMKVMK